MNNQDLGKWHGRGRYSCSCRKQLPMSMAAVGVARSDVHKGKPPPVAK